MIITAQYDEYMHSTDAHLYSFQAKLYSDYSYTAINHFSDVTELAIGQVILLNCYYCMY